MNCSDSTAREGRFWRFIFAVALIVTIVGMFHNRARGAEQIKPCTAVYAYYAQTQGWDQRQVDFQVINRSRATAIVTSGWDPHSIMEYPIPQGLANVIIGWNEKLTPRDIAALRTLYP